MRALKDQVIGAGFTFFATTGLHRVFESTTAGLGAILMLHHVRPFNQAAFAPNRLLEIEPDYLDAVLTHLAERGFDFVSMDEAVGRLKRSDRGIRRFIAITFDDGYRDLLKHALPILERHRAPFTVYATSGFCDGTARLWWLELEDAIRALARIDAELVGMPADLLCGTPQQKATAFRKIYWLLRSLPEQEMLDRIALLAQAAGQEIGGHARQLCCGWTEIRHLAAHPLCTIGAHTISHPRLAKHEEGVVRRELADGRRHIEEHIGLPVRHLAYPVGDPTSAGPREFALAAECGFTSAVTTRPGLLFPDHGKALMALPRLSLNGNWQSLSNLDVLLSGLPFALWNRKRAA